MGAHNKLPVFDVLGEAFSFGWKKLIPLIVLTLLTSILIFGPIGALAITQFPDLIGDLVSLQDQIEATDLSDEDAARVILEYIVQLLPLLMLIFVGSILYSCIFNSVLIRAIANGEALMFPKINGNVFRYLGAVILTMLLVIPVGLITLAIILGGAALTETLGEQGALIMIPTIILAIAFYFFGIIRLSFIPIDAVSNSEINIKRGWSVAKGNVLRVIGMFFLAIILIVVIAIGVMLVTMPLQMMAMGEFAALTEEMIEENPMILFEMAVEAAQTPAGLIYILASSLADIYMTAVMASLPVLAYVRMKSGE